MLSSAELCLAGPREPGGAAVGHQAAPPARQDSCRETQEAPRPQAKLTRGRLALRPTARCAGAPDHLAPASDNAASLPGALGAAGLPAPQPHPHSLIPLLWPPE